MTRDIIFGKANAELVTATAASAVSTTTATAATAATTSASASPPSSAIFTGTRFVHRNGATLELGEIEGCNGFFRPTCHFNETEPAGATRFTIRYNLR